MCTSVAAAVLYALVIGNTENKATITEAGAIEPLVALARGGRFRAKRDAAATLKKLADKNADNEEAMERLGFSP